MSEHLNILSMLPQKMTTTKAGHVVTPEAIAKEMVQAVIAKIPEDLWTPKLTILNIYSKDGVFLRLLVDEIFERTRHFYVKDGLTDAEIDEACMKHIIKHQVYAICADRLTQMLSIRTAFGYPAKDTNIILIEDYEAKIKANSKLLGEVIKKNFETLYNREDIKKLGENNMKAFDIVIGNPPYNSDMYLDFVTLGHKLINKNGVECMITPAKWQAKTDAKVGKDGIDKNIKFREEIVPYMSDITFYRDTHEIFDIDDNAGMCYYILGTKVLTERSVKSICSKNISLESDAEMHDELNVTLLPRKILTIIGKVGTLGEGFKQSLYVKNTDHGEETIDSTLGFKRQTFVHEQDRGEALKKLGYVEVMQGEKVCGYKKIQDLYTTEKLDKWKCICSIMIGGAVMFGDGTTVDSTKVIGSPKIHAIGPNQVPKGSFPVLRYFDTQAEALSFISYFETKLMSFLFYLGVCGATITKEFFRFIPDPGKFDHIFTDAELYKKYNLTDEEIEIIESVIKERK